MRVKNRNAEVDANTQQMPALKHLRTGHNNPYNKP